MLATAYRLPYSANFEAAGQSSGELIIGNKGVFRRFKWSEILDRAEIGSRDPSFVDLEGKDNILVIGATSKEMVAAIAATWWRGISVTVISPPLRRRGIPAVQKRLTDTIETIDPGLILHDESARAVLKIPADRRSLRLEDWYERTGALRVRASNVNGGTRADSVAITQMTSGTTGRPKGVEITYANLVSNQNAISEAINVDAPNEVAVSWLPLSHDMGLVGLLGMAMAHGSTLVLSDPSEFARSPADWMKNCSDFGATITAGPDLAYRVAGQLLKGQELDLSSLRVALNGSDVVNVETCENFLDLGERHGLRTSALLPVYGLAEASLAVTIPQNRQRFGIVNLSRSKLDGRDSGLHRSVEMTALASLGRPVGGMTVEIVDEVGRECRDGEIGEVWISGPSVFRGYRRSARSSEFRKAPHPTGDLGVMQSGELAITGRKSDVIIVGGRNLYPHEIEAAAGLTPHVWRENVAAFGVSDSGRERIVLVVESEHEPNEKIRREVREAVAEALDVRVKEVVVVPPRSIPKTPSGKTSRGACREIYRSKWASQ
jgi:fatty-acyl-CoA synthase